MRASRRWLVFTALCLCLLGWTFSARAQFDDVPGGGGESDLLSAIQNAEQDGSYYVIFDGAATISLTAPIEIPNDVPYFTIDGNGFNPTISGGGSNIFVFQIDSSVDFTAIDLTISDGENTNGGAIYVQQDAELYMTNCVLANNSALGTNGNPGANGFPSLQNNGQNGQRGPSGSPGLGGAIFNLGSVILLDCLVSNNVARGGNAGAGGAGGNGGGELSQGGNGGAGGGGGLALGGAICNFGSPPQDGSSIYSVVVSNCTFAGNNVTGGDGGTGGGGGSGFTSGLSGSGGVGGSASGGALYSTTAVCVVNCTFANNTATAGASAAGGAGPTKGKSGPAGPNSFGGGIAVIGSDGMESDITNSTFYGNVVIGGTGGDGGKGGVNGGQGGHGGNGTGGSIYFMSVKVPLDNLSSFSEPKGRKATKTKQSFTNSTLVAVNCTFQLGTAAGGTNGSGGTGPVGGVNGNRGHGYGGNIASGAGHFTLMGNIIGTNITGNAGSGKFIDAGYNLLQDRSIALGKKSRSKVNPQLGPLQNNGGLTPTMRLLVPSPATNKIPMEFLPATDQRGVPRPAYGDFGDIGAFELVSAPIILTPPLNIVTTNGSFTNFTVQALGNEENVRQTLSYQWRINGTNIIGANQSNYFASPTATFTNQGGYDVLVWSGTNTSQTVTSTPPAYYLFAPYITTQPLTNQGILQGSNATLTATAIGTVPLNAVGSVFPFMGYQWQVNGTNLTTNILVAAPSQVTLLNSNLANYTVQLSTTIFGDITNAGNYTVAVTNNYGGITSSICVVPVGVAITSAPPSTVSGVLGSSVTLSVGASGTAPLQYSWTFQANPGSPVSTVGGNSPTLTISPITSSSYGTYNVTVANTVNSAGAQVNVVATNTAPIIQTQPANQALIVNSNATFSVVAFGGTLTYQWLFDGANIPGATGSAYTVANAQNTNAGAYSVLVANAEGTNQSSYAYLELAPSIVIQPTSQTATLGSNATFSVTASGGGLNYLWLFNNGSNVLTGAVVTNTLTPTLTNFSTLTFTNVQTNNFGNYSVQIANLVGTITSSIVTLSTNSGPVAARAEERVSIMPLTRGSAAAPALVEPSLITSVATASNAITFVYPGVAGATYVLEYKANLADPDWLPLSTNIPATDGPVSYQDATTNGSSRYYRIQVR